MAWRVEKTLRHGSYAQKPSSTVPEAFFCNLYVFLDYFYLIYFELLLFCNMEMWVYEKNIIKRNLCVCIFFLCKLLNYKIRKTKKNEFNVLICIWSSI